MDGRREREAARAQAIRAEREWWNRLPAEEQERWRQANARWRRLPNGGLALEKACEQLSDAATRAALDAYALAQLIARKDPPRLRTEWIEAGRRLLGGMALCDGAIEALRRLRVYYDPAGFAPAAPAAAPRPRARPADVREARNQADVREEEGWVYDEDA